MKTFFKVVIWFMAAVFGLFVWKLRTPDFRPLITWILAAAFICYVLSLLTMLRLADELLELPQTNRSQPS